MHLEYAFRKPEEIEGIVLNILSHITLDKERQDKIELGLTELMLNSIEHGNLNFGYDDKALYLNMGIWHEKLEEALRINNKMSTVRVIISADALQIIIADQGHGFDFREYFKHHKSGGSPNGRGITIARSCFDSVEYADSGNVVMLMLLL